MKNKILFSLMLLITIAGGAGLLYIESTLPDQDKINNEVNASLLEIEYLNSSLNQLVLRSRLNIDTSYDELAETTANISSQLNLLSETHFSEEKIANSVLKQRFEEFKSAIEIKSDHIENFKSSNSILRNSDRYVPIVGKELVQISNDVGLTDTAQLYEDIIIDTMIFTKQIKTEEPLNVASYTNQIVLSEDVMPKESTIKLIEFSNHVATIGQSKQSTDGYMQQAISIDESVDIQEIQNAWGDLLVQNNKSRELLKYYSIAYIALVLGMIFLLIVRLRNSYKSLDDEVKLKTDQVTSAYEDLRTSERQLAQSEKMASLGQLVAGIAHQVNTPLAFASSNVEIVKSKLSSLLPFLDSSRKLGDAVLNKQYDNQSLRTMISEQVNAYAKAKAVKAGDLVGLLDDSKEGLTEIQQTVEALTSHSHIDSGLFEDVAIDSVVDRAVKMCKPRFADRKIFCEFGGSNLYVHAVPNQLTQVMINFMNNALDATDEETGIISIKVFANNGFVELSVSDDGDGINKENIDHVFDPFFTTKDVGEGTGLGLSINHQIITAHKGEIVVSSDPETGSKFTIKLPRVNTVEETTMAEVTSEGDSLAPA